MSAPHMDHASPGNHSVTTTTTSKLVGPGHAETVHASERFDKAGLQAAHLAALHDAYMLERGLLPGTSLPNSEAPPIPPVYAESPWKDFKLLSLSEMKVGKTHRRHALEGTLCAKSLKVTSVVNVLEEDSGLATKLILTNALPVRASMAQAQNCYPEGSRVTVRDPYLTRFPDGVVGVLVERPNDIAFLSRPENPGDNGNMIYGAVGYEDERDAHTLSREHEDFSRKIHLFEQQVKQEQIAQLESLESRRMSGMFQSTAAVSQYREDHAHAAIRSSPPKLEATETPPTPAPAPPPPSPPKEDLKEVILETHSREAESVASAPLDRLQDSSPPQEEERIPSPSPVVVELAEAELEAATSTAAKADEVLPGTEESVEEPTTPKAEERRATKDVDTPEEVSVDSVPEVVRKSLELSPDESKEIPEDTPLLADAVTEEPEITNPSDEAAADPIAEKSTANDHHETVENGKSLAPEIKRPLVRKTFQRSDSLLAVQEVEDTKARAHGASAAAPRGESPAAAVVEAPSAERSNEISPTNDDDDDNSSNSNSNQKKEQEATAPPTPASASAAAQNDALENHSANDLRVLGNLLFGEENFRGAADLYTRSIHLAEAEEKRQGKLVRNSEIILGYSNRAEAYIRLQEFGNALADAKKALSRDPSHLKSLFRKGRALLGLSQYEQALTTLQAAAPRAPTDRDLQAALHESSTGVQQSCHGHYDLSHYYLRGKQSHETPFSADYVGPIIVTDVGRGRARGLVLTKDVEAGELLLVSNPMAFLPLHDVEQSRREVVSQAFVDGKVQEGFRALFETEKHRGLEKMLTLCDGERALPAPSVHQADVESAVGAGELHLDHARVRRIIQLNAINGDATMGWKNLPGSGEHDSKVEHWGLWWLPSFLNHSCLPSSSPILVGKALFVFAARDLRAGDEVTRPYFDIFQPLDQRKELSTKGWGFVCYCPRCKLEDALHTSLSEVTVQYTKLMELASKSKAEFGTDEQLSETQTAAALKFFQKLEAKLRDFKLNAAENNWVRASFLHYIDMISGDHELHTHLESIVEALVTVCPGSETTLHMAVVAKDSARRTFGKKSTQFKAANQRALNICRFTYGKQKASVLQSIVDKNDYQS